VGKPVRKTFRTRRERGTGGHRFEHWYVDNQVYFITARCRDQYPAFAAEGAKAVFWDRFKQHTENAGFVPFVVSLMDNHYHLLGYNRSAEALERMMQRLHGSVAKLVNDLLPERRSQFWRDARGREFFDGCIRDELQIRRAWRYTLLQAERHGICADCRDYPHTRVYLDRDRAIARALELGAFMPEVPYPRYH
jgi:REP element-mobilizing transposase RayT